MNDFKLGNPHDGWDMMVGKAQYGILLDGIVEDGLPEGVIGSYVEIIKGKATTIEGELSYQYLIDIRGMSLDIDCFWFVDSDSIEINKVW